MTRKKFLLKCSEAGSIGSLKVTMMVESAGMAPFGSGPGANSTPSSTGGTLSSCNQPDPVTKLMRFWEALISGLPVMLRRTNACGLKDWNSGTVVLGGTALRFLTALVLAAPAVFVPGIDKRVLVVCLAASYMLMLPIDAYFAVRTLQRREESES